MSTKDDLPRDLAQAHPTTPEQLHRLRDRLAGAAQAEDVLDVAYRAIDSPVGLLLLAATDLGLVRVAYATEDHDAVLQPCPTGSAPASSTHGWTPPPGSWRSASQAAGRTSTCRWTGV